MNNITKQLKEFKTRYNITQIDLINFFNINIQLNKIGFFSFSKKNELKKRRLKLKTKYMIGVRHYGEFSLLLDKADIKIIEQISELTILEEKAKKIKEEAREKAKKIKEEAREKAKKIKEEAKAKKIKEERKINEQEKQKKEAKDEAEEKVKKEAEAKFKLKKKELDGFFKNIDNQELKLFACPDCDKQISARSKNCSGCGGPISSQQLIIPRAIQWLEEHCKCEYATYIYPDKVVLKFAEICKMDIVNEGDQYIGEIKDGLANGKGIFSWDGNIYVGQFKKCFCDGIGRTTYDSGHSHEGEYKDDKRHGQGTYTFANGNKYVGEYKDSKMHGQGTYTWADGDKYVGNWKDGKRHGQGTYTVVDGDYSIKADEYVGEWKDGKKHGQGTYTYSRGDKYIGEYKNDKIHGQGTMTFASGDVAKVFSKEWKNGKNSGKNHITDRKGKTVIRYM
jgi:hypothetical protein